MSRIEWPQGKRVPAIGDVWERKRNGRLVTITSVPVSAIAPEVHYDMGGGRGGYTWTGDWHRTFTYTGKTAEVPPERRTLLSPDVHAEMMAIADRIGITASPLVVTDGSVSQQITRLLGTDDWAILHSGHEMVTDVELDEIEGKAAVTSKRSRLLLNIDGSHEVEVTE